MTSEVGSFDGDCGHRINFKCWAQGYKMSCEKKPKKLVAYPNDPIFFKDDRKNFCCNCTKKEDFTVDSNGVVTYKKR